MVMKLLFLNGEFSHTIDVIKFLKKNIPELEIHIFVSKEIFFHKSIYVDFIHFADNKEIIEQVFNLNNQFHFDWIIPVGYPEIEIFSRCKERLKNTFVVDTEVLSLCVYKEATLNIASKLGIPIPKSMVINSLHLYKNAKIEFPVFIKSYRESGGGGVKGVAYNFKEYEKLCVKIFNFGDKPIVQEFIDSPYTFGVGFFAERGEMRQCFIHKEIYSIPPQGGSGILLENFYDQKLLTYTERLLNHLKYSGIGLAEYKFCSKRKDYVLMEINSKFWASIAFALYCNPNILSVFQRSAFKTSEIRNRKIKYIYMNRLITNFKYSPAKSINCLLRFLVSTSKKKINIDISGLKYRLFRVRFFRPLVHVLFKNVIKSPH